MFNKIERGPLANALVFHDFKRNPVDLKGLFYFVEEWFKQGDIKPTKMDITGKNGIKGRSTIKFENGKKHLENCNFDGIDGVWIGALPPHAGTEMADFIFAVHLHSHPRGTATIVLCWDNQIIKFDKEHIETLTKDLYAYLAPAYGYCYQRAFCLGPTFYPFGVLTGIDSFSQEAQQITKWGIEYGGSRGDYQTGMLRDIYPINFLSSPHLEWDVYGQSLKNWILSSPEHGHLKQLDETIWSWHIEEEKISSVREDLRNTGILLCI